MSFPGFATPAALGASISALLSVQTGPPRNIGGIIADCTLEEEGVDELEITEHPVEQGAAITDHVYRQPARLTLRVGWSNSSLAAGFDPNYVTDIYNQLRTLQRAGQLFSVTTGKRLYTNMQMTTLQLNTDERTEEALDIVCQFRELIIVQTQVTPAPSAPAANQAFPQQTSMVQNLGSKQLIPATIPTPSF